MMRGGGGSCEQEQDRKKERKKERKLATENNGQLVKPTLMPIEFATVSHP